MEDTLKEISLFVEKEPTWFSTDLDEDEQELIIDTRDHGDVGDETYGQEDYMEGKRLQKSIEQKWPQVNVSFDTCDEWIIIVVTLKS